MTGIGWLDALLNGASEIVATVWSYIWTHKAGVVALGSFVVAAIAFWRAGLPKSARWLLEEIPPAPSATLSFESWGLRNVGEHAASRVSLTAARRHDTGVRGKFRIQKYTYPIVGQVGSGQIGSLAESEGIELRVWLVWYEDEKVYGYPPVHLPAGSDTVSRWERRGVVRWRGAMWPWRRQSIDLY